MRMALSGIQPRVVEELLPPQQRQALITECLGLLEAARKTCMERTPIDRQFDVSRQFSRAMDALALHIVQTHVDAAKGECDPERIVVAMIGGNGREMLSLYSDMDMLILTPDSLTDKEESLLKSLMHVLWDLKLEVGQAVRTIQQCLQQASSDLDSATSMLETRLIWGSAAMHLDFSQRIGQKIHKEKRDWFQRTLNDRRNLRHQQFGSTIYTLEPNVKDGIGGLRDYHSMLWQLYAATGDASPSRLAEMDILTAEECDGLLDSVEFMLKIRNYLHFFSGRKSDVLTFERQTQIAREMDYQRDELRLAEENFMHGFYHHAREIQQLTQRAVNELAVRQPNALNKLYWKFARRSAGRGLYVHSGELILPGVTDDYFLAQPDRVMDVLSIASRERVPVSESLKNLIRRTVPMLDAEAFRSSAGVRTEFINILNNRGWTMQPVRDMYDTGVLTLYIPEFSALYCLPQMDRYHHYTADEHSIRTLRHSDNLWSREVNQKTPLIGRMREAARGLKRWHLLNLALLLHDAGKGRGSGHALRGAQIAQRVADRIGMPTEEGETLHFLIQKHHRLLHTALRRDINDPEVVRRFAEEIGDAERLRLLHLMTYCDLRAVSPETWTDWKGVLMQQLYDHAMLLIKGGSIDRLFEAQDRQELLAQLREQIEPEIKDRLIEQFVHNLPQSYLASARFEHVLAHWRLSRELDSGKSIAWELHRAENSNLSELMVCAPDNPGVFSLICGALASKKLNIHAAQIFSSRDGLAMDFFQVSHWNGEQVPEGFNLDRVRNLLDGIISGKRDEAELISSIPSFPPLPAANTRRKPPAIIINNTASANHTILEVKTHDQPGLLFHLTRAMIRCKLDIHLALIANEAYRVVDVFYVTDLESKKIDKPEEYETLLQAFHEELGYTLEIDRKNSTGIQ